MVWSLAAEIVLGLQAPAGMTLTLHGQPGYRAEASVVVHTTLQNQGSKPFPIWLCGVWPNHKLALFSSDGKRVPESPLGKQRLARFGSTDRDKNVKFDIPPKSAFQTAVIDLRQHFKIGKGRYTLIATYSDREKPPGPVTIRSQPFRFEIK